MKSPHPLNLLPTMAAAAFGAARMSQRELDHELQPSRTALAAMRDGKFGIGHWRHLVDVANLAEQLTDMHIGQNLRDQVDDGQRALAEVIAYANVTGRWEASPGQVERLDELLVVFGAQLQCCSRSQVNKAKDRLVALMRQAAAGKAPGITVHGLTDPAATSSLAH